ncbi:hypothetical protein BH09CHL1_BH09CHL1_03990 [soil metagenome]
MAGIRRSRFARVFVPLAIMFTLILSGFSAIAPQSASATNPIYTLDINVYECSVDATGLSYGQIAPNCALQTSPGFFFAVSLNNGGGTLEAEAGGGTASFAAGFGPGDWTMSETFLPGYDAKRVFCSYYDENGNAVLSNNPMGDSGWTAYLYVAGDATSIVCDWFHYDTTPQPTYGDVTVNKITCPSDFDAYSASIYDLAANCHEPPKVAEFRLTDSSGASINDSTPGQGVNTASWTGIPSGSLTIEETQIDGYGVPRVFCKNEKLTGEGDPETEVSVNGNIATSELKSGYDYLYCDWFNIPTYQGEVDIYINKFACPDNYYSDDPYDLASECHEYYDPISFNAAGNLIGPSNQNPQTTGDGPGSYVEFTNLPEDTWTISEDLPDGYGKPVVFCKFINNSTSEESSYEYYDIYNDNAISAKIDAGYTLYCDWYNFKEAPYSGIYIHKYGCPETYDRNWDLSKWQQYCTSTVHSVSFEVSFPDGSSDEQPVNGIDVIWEQIPSGDYGIKEYRPSGYDGSVVYCAIGSYTADLGSYESYDVQSDSISKELSDYEYLDCYWFNLPKPKPTPTSGNGGNTTPTGPATLTIVKYTCPESYDPLERNANPVRDCDDYTDGIAFSVANAQGAVVSGNTGDDGDGTVKFDNLKAGSYLVTETYPENVHEAFIWSCESNYRSYEYPFTPFAHIGELGKISIALIAGESVTCTWYNVPSPPENEHSNSSTGVVELSITVLECTGQAINSNACDPADAGVDVDLFATNGSGSDSTLTTDNNGLAIGSVDSGEYDVSTDSSICFSQSDQFTADGTLDLTAVDAAEVTLYLCDR